jgi:DNA-binding winged helix-turn-helix (wHTH) protein
MQPTGTTPKVVRIRKLEVDLHTGDLWKNSVRTKLPEQPRQILAILVEHAGELVTRETLRKTLWPHDTFVDFEHSLNTAMMRLREALGDSSENPRFIETFPRRGYRFVAPVEPCKRVKSAARALSRLFPRRLFPAWQSCYLKLDCHTSPPLAPRRLGDRLSGNDGSLHLSAYAECKRHGS